MEIQRTQTADFQQNAHAFEGVADEFNTLERLNSLLLANAEIARQEKTFRTLQEKVDADLMKNPVSTQQAFSIFGLLLGIFPPASIFFKFLSHDKPEPVVFVLLLFINIICAVAGYFSGKLIGKIVSELEKHSWHLMLPLLPFIGLLWGVMTGGAGGFIVFIIGAFFGAFFASLVGGVAIPAFAIFHRLLKRGEMIERKQLMPLAFGLTFIISAFILGM